MNDRGRVLVDPAMRSISHPRIFAAGDAAVPVVSPGAPVGMAVGMDCQSALPMGAHTADSLTAVLAGRAPGPHRIEGIGIGFVPPRWRRTDVHAIDAATTDESNAMARRLAREEGVLAGTSTGLNVIVALRVAERLGPDATVATIAIDSGLRYLSTDVFRA